MLKFLGKPYRQCDGVTRRGFLTAGALGVGQLTLPTLLRAEAEQELGRSRKAIINIHLDGGPPQMDTIDLKPNAPVELRGEFKPISTRVPGFQICELMPRIAAMADRLAFIRSLVGAEGRHDAFQCMSGFAQKDLASLGGRPAFGCVIHKLLGQPDDVAPSFVDMMQGRPLVRNSARPGFLGPAFSPFRPDLSQVFPRPLEPGMEKELAALGSNHSVSLSLDQSLDSDRLDGRRQLLSRLDRLKREFDAAGMMEAMDAFHQKAANILTSGELAKALDLSNVSAEELARYTAESPSVARFTTADDHRSMRKLLLARRLIEAGVRCVSVTLSDFDTHSKNFQRMRHLLPILDVGLHALVNDLDQRGMLRDVLVVVWGEFGRTPKINKQGGRDHWPRVSPAILVGGRIQGGAVIGATDRVAGTAVARPVHYQDILATIYHHLGINARQVTVLDPTGRPQYLLDRGQPVHELL